MTQRRNHRRTDRGAALVETAILATLLLTLLLGTLEFGMAWRASNNAGRAVRAAVLEESRAPDTRLTDFEMLERLRSTDGGIDDLDWVMVYRIEPADSGEPPAACVAAAAALGGGSAGITDVCNAFHGSLVASATAGDFTDPTCAGEPDVWLCPATRGAVFGPGDRIGVAMSLTHEWISGMPPGDGKTITDHGVAFRLPGLEEL